MYYKYRTIFAKGKLIVEIAPNTKVATKDFTDMLAYARKQFVHHTSVVCGFKSVIFAHKDKNNKVEAIDFMCRYKQTYF